MLEQERQGLSIECGNATLTQCSAASPLPRSTRRLWKPGRTLHARCGPCLCLRILRVTQSFHMHFDGRVCQSVCNICDLRAAQALGGDTGNDNLYDAGDDGPTGANDSDSRKGGTALYDTGDDGDGPAPKARGALGGSAIYDTGDDDTVPVKAAAKTGARPGAASQIYDTGDDFVVPAPPALKAQGDDVFGFDDSFEAPLVVAGTATTTTTAGASPVLGRSASATGERVLLPEELGSQHVGLRVAVDKFGDGTLRFFGPHHRDGKQRCGVELDEANGINNGTIGVSHGHGPALVSPMKCLLHWSFLVNFIIIICFPELMLQYVRAWNVATVQ